MYDAIVVGAGVIGSTVTKSLQMEGMKVLCVDSKKSMAGTPPSGGHLRPEWFKGMKKDDYTPAIDLLEEVWGLEHEKFFLKGSKKYTSVMRLDTDLIMDFPSENYNVLKVNYQDKFPVVTLKDKFGVVEEQTKMLVLAVGVWASELVPELFDKNPIKEKQGISFRYNTKLDRPFIKTWEPYKQIVCHQQTDKEVWAGDGSAILKKNWTPERSVQCEKRCRDALRTKNPPVKTFTGLRAYCNLPQRQDPCLVLRPNPKTWVITGAGKSGTIGAGWVSSRILRSL